MSRNTLVLKDIRDWKLEQDLPDLRKLEACCGELEFGNVKSSLAPFLDWMRNEIRSSVRMREREREQSQKRRKKHSRSQSRSRLNSRSKAKSRSKSHSHSRSRSTSSSSRRSHHHHHHHPHHRSGTSKTPPFSSSTPPQQQPPTVSLSYPYPFQTVPLQLSYLNVASATQQSLVHPGTNSPHSFPQQQLHHHHPPPSPPPHRFFRKSYPTHLHTGQPYLGNKSTVPNKDRYQYAPGKG